MTDWMCRVKRKGARWRVECWWGDGCDPYSEDFDKRWEARSAAYHWAQDHMLEYLTMRRAGGPPRL